MTNCPHYVRGYSANSKCLRNSLSSKTPSYRCEFYLGIFHFVGARKFIDRVWLTYVISISMTTGIASRREYFQNRCQTRTSD